MKKESSECSGVWRNGKEKKEERRIKKEKKTCTCVEEKKRGEKKKKEMQCVEDKKRGGNKGKKEE